LIKSSDKNNIDCAKIVLIDFGVSKQYMDSYGEHKKFTQSVPFCGNILFASKNAFIGS